jgi:hypothetical protein
MSMFKAYVRLDKLAALAAFLGLAFAGGTSWADGGCKAAFRATVQPILNANCVSCHQDASPAGDLSLQASSAPASLIGVPSRESKLVRVAPGHPQQSYMFRKISGTHVAAGGNGQRMPLGGQLADGDISAIGGWIAGCAGP